jgi:hypothetical protein
MRKFEAVLAATVLTACVAVAQSPAPGPEKSQGHGPPAHAPAYGYRAKTPQGVNITFDTGIGVYVAVDVPGLYWLDERYYRNSATGWQVSAGFEGPWTVCASGDLPVGLQREDSKPGKSKQAKGNNRK